MDKHRRKQVSDELDMIAKLRARAVEARHLGLTREESTDNELRYRT